VELPALTIRYPPSAIRFFHKEFSLHSDRPP
jgi:hypothetical protein